MTEQPKPSSLAPKIDDVIDGMSARMPWRVAAKVLAHHGAPRARGWELLREKLTSQKSAVDIAGLSNAFLDHVLHGEKASRFYTVEQQDVKSYKAKFDNLETLSVFPFSILSNKYDISSVSTPKLCFVSKEEAGTSLVYTSVRASEKKEHIDLSGLPKDAKDYFKQFKEVVGVTQDRFRAFDVVWIPNEGTTIELRVDFPPGTNAETAELAVAQSLKEFSSDVEVASVGNPVNLFPIIKKVYDKSDEGRIVELALHTSTGSLKHEKMRAGEACLRTELYHLGGKSALKGAIELFKLGVRWDVEYEDEGYTNPELFLNGNYRMLHSNSATLETAVIRNCAGAEDYNFVRGKIDHYLQTDDL